MVEISRRRFLTKTSLGAGVAIAAAAALPTTVAMSVPPRGEDAQSVAPIAAAYVPGVTLLEPMVVHVRDMATAEIAVLVGTQEFIYRDPELVARLVQTARQAANPEA